MASDRVSRSGQAWQLVKLPSTAGRTVVKRVCVDVSDVQDGHRAGNNLTDWMDAEEREFGQQKAEHRDSGGRKSGARADSGRLLKKHFTPL